MLQAVHTVLKTVACRYSSGGPPSADGTESNGEGTRTHTWSNAGSNGSGSARGSTHLQGPCNSRAPAEQARGAGGKEQSGMPVPEAVPEGGPVPPTEGAVAALNRSNCAESGLLLFAAQYVLHWYACIGQQGHALSCLQWPVPLCCLFYLPDSWCWPFTSVSHRLACQQTVALQC